MAMTMRETAALLDRQAMLRIESFGVLVTILDVRECYGRTDVLVTPVSGTGEQWCSLDRVTLAESSTVVD